MRVLGAQVADGGIAHVTDQQIRLQLLGQLRGLNRLSLVEWPSTQEHLAELVETDAPTQRRSVTSMNRERRFVFGQGS
jgi:hypothetical protein